MSWSGGIAIWRGDLHGWYWASIFSLGHGWTASWRLEVKNAGLVNFMDFRTRHKVLIWTALFLLRVFCVRGAKLMCWLSSKWPVCFFPLEVAEYLLQIILMVCSLGSVVMWPKHLLSCSRGDWGTLPPCDWNILSMLRGGGLWNTCISHCCV